MFTLGHRIRIELQILLQLPSEGVWLCNWILPLRWVCYPSSHPSSSCDVGVGAIKCIFYFRPSILRIMRPRWNNGPAVSVDGDYISYQGRQGSLWFASGHNFSSFIKSNWQNVLGPVDEWNKVGFTWTAFLVEISFGITGSVSVCWSTGDESVC